MSPHLLSEFHRLRGKGWHCVENAVQPEWPAAINSRYPWVPQDVRDAMVELQEVVSADQTCWLLTARDYAGDSESSFAWNEWERLSMEAAGDDRDWIERIQTFWDQHLPICLSVKDGYAYFALQEDGSVVTGREPEFEETTVVAPNYERFIAWLAHSLDSPPQAPRG
jgi:hypothetical protein